jgi:multidrug resistance protein, MATE family
VSLIARNYCVTMIPGVWALGQFDATKRFLSSQERAAIPVITQILTTLLHYVWLVYFVNHLDMKEFGVAIATNLTYVSNMIIADVWLRLRSNHEYKDMIFFYDRTAFDSKQMRIFLRIGVPGMFMLCFEWWAFELLAIFTGYIGVDELAAEVVIINIVTFIFMLPLGISCAASAFTGKYLGQRKIISAKKQALMTILVDIVLTSLVVLFLGLFRTEIAQLFTGEPNVVKIIENTMWVLLIYIWFDTIHGVQSGIIRGLGRQKAGSIYTLICYYPIGMTLALVFAFVLDWGIEGMWLGFTFACIILDIGFFLIICLPDWHKIADK